MGAVTLDLDFSKVNPKQKLALEDKHKYIGYGGARGGGKSWFVRIKAILLACFFAGIKILIVRQSFPELMNNHIREMRSTLFGVAKYVDKEKIFYFPNGSTIQFMYCQRDKDLDRFQGTEYDVIFIDEATHLSEYQIKTIGLCLRGANDFPKRIYFTTNPGGASHHYFKRIFIDKDYMPDENPDDYSFIQALVTDNTALMESQPDYIEQLKNLPEKQKRMFLYGLWDVAEGMFFEDFRVGTKEQQATGLYTHVIEPFEIPPNWTIYRSFDWGYHKPFSVGWWAVDYDGVLYRIMELYGCVKNEANEGLQWDPQQVFQRVKEIETTHRWLKGKNIIGIADPAIWQKTTGISIYDVAARNGVYFQKGDNNRIAGWQQVHYRFTFAANGKPRMYIFNTCKNTIRTLPTLQYDEHKVEDLDTDGEDHIADEIRYMCNKLPIKPIKSKPIKELADDPLNQRGEYRSSMNNYGIKIY